MNAKQVSHKNMFEATLNFLDENASTWQSIAKIVTAKTQLSQYNKAIDAAAETQAKSEATIGKTKLALKKSLAIKGDILNDLVEVYATLEGNDELARQMGDTQTDLYKMPYEKLIIRIKLIIEKALELKETLIAEYGMTEEQVTDLQNDLDTLLEISGQPRAYQIKSVVATKELSQLFDVANDLLKNQLDKLLSIFKKRDVNFYNGYVKARLVVD